MPNLLTSGAKTPQERAIDILQASTLKTWNRDRKAAIAVLSGME